MKCQEKYVCTEHHSEKKCQNVLVVEDVILEKIVVDHFDSQNGLKLCDFSPQWQVLIRHYDQD